MPALALVQEVPAQSPPGEFHFKQTRALQDFVTRVLSDRLRGGGGTDWHGTRAVPAFTF